MSGKMPTTVIIMGVVDLDPYAPIVSFNGRDYPAKRMTRVTRGGGTYAYSISNIHDITSSSAAGTL